MSAQPHPRLTAEEYLAIERAAEFKSEFYDGVMYAMAGGSPTHSLIIASLTAALWQALKSRPCRVFVTELRVRVDPQAYTYPDIAVVCGEPRTSDDDNLLNPTMLIEVLSPSTESHDRGLKFERYRRLASLNEYVLVSQSEPRVETYVRQASGSWLFTEITGLDSTASFDAVECKIPLGEIYHQVQFPAR
jgi:Uma2 family endonuclease